MFLSILCRTLNTVNPELQALEHLTMWVYLDLQEAANEEYQTELQDDAWLSSEVSEGMQGRVKGIQSSGLGFNNLVFMRQVRGAARVGLVAALCFLMAGPSSAVPGIGNGEGKLMKSLALLFGNLLEESSFPRMAKL